MLAYLADIFSALNELNLILQGVSVTVFNTQDRIEAMIKTLRFWVSCVSGNTHLCFPMLHEFLWENDLDLGEHVKSLIIEHLNQLVSSYGNTSQLWTQLVLGFAIHLKFPCPSHSCHFTSRSS